MTKKKTTKRALVASLLVLVMCISMLVGSTFAWFTDSVTSSGNIIKSGKLKVSMMWAEGKNDPATTAWTNAEDGAIFNNELWEPGYVEAKHIKVENIGNLALKYQMRIIANGVVSELAEVIDVYFYDTATQLDRTLVGNATKIGTLAEVIGNTNVNALAAKISGTLEADEEKVVTLALKMQETAGNAYQNLAIGTDFSVQLLATQLTSEKDSFDEKYDTNADFESQETPAAMVYALSPSKLQTITVGGTNGAKLDTGYSFQPTETYEQSLESEYAWAHADFFVYADKKVPANSIALAGYYNAFNGMTIFGQTLSPTSWIGLVSPTDVEAGAANGLRLIADGMNGGSTNSGITIPYNAICQLGNDGTGFLCGATDLTGENSGTTLTVELRLYKTYPQGECPADHNGHSSKNCETGEYVTVGTFTYTFPEKPKVVVYDSVANGGLYEYLPTLNSGDTLILPEGTYNLGGTLPVPAGVTIKGAEGKTVVFHQNSTNQDDIFNCAGDAVFENITFESNRKGYAITDNTKDHDTDGNITVINCKFTGIAAEKNYGIYKNLYGNLTVKNCTFDNYNNAICGVNNQNGSTTIITGCTFTNINGEAIGYVKASTPADFESTVIAANTGLTADNVIGYPIA